MVQTVEENKVGLSFDNFTFSTCVNCFIAMTFHFEAADLTFEVQVSWVDLGTDVDWARRTVEQMEKVFVQNSAQLFVGHILMEVLNCCQEIKMAEQKYSESDSSTSSDSTMQARI